MAADENVLIANHAAYALFQHVEMLRDERQAAVLVPILSRISHDPRPTVRMAAAYSAARLRLLTTIPAVEQVAEEMEGRLKNDSYLLVSRRVRMGVRTAQRDFEARSTSNRG